MGRSYFVVQVTPSKTGDDICEKLAQMRKKHGLVLKHVNEGSQKINVVNYLNKNQPLFEDCYNEEDTYAMNDYTEGFDATPKVRIQIIRI